MIEVWAGRSGAVRKPHLPILGSYAFDSDFITHKFPCCIGDLFGVGDNEILHHRCEGDRHGHRCDPLNRCIQIVKRFPHDKRGDLRAETGSTNCLMRDEQPIRFRTELRMLSLSSGISVLGSITSAEMPSSASVSAAMSAFKTIREVARIVTSSPSRFTSATPNGIVYSSSGISPSSV